MNEVTINGLPELPYAVEEALNRLRINIGFCGQGYKKIMVISSMPNEGKTFITIEMWRMFAMAGMKSVLLDADMRKSVMSEKYDIRSEKKVEGLSDYLAGNMKLDKVLCKTNIENGYLLPNTTNVINPSILLENQRMEELMKELESQFEYVFVDSPPLNLVSDGERLGAMCDGAVLVIRGSETPKALVRNSIRQLERAGCPLLGVVLNRVLVAGSGYYSKRYGGKYYGKYGYGKKYGYGYGGYYYYK